jgi:hypothetical protein
MTWLEGLVVLVPEEVKSGGAAQGGDPGGGSNASRTAGSASAESADRTPANGIAGPAVHAHDAIQSVAPSFCGVLGSVENRDCLNRGRWFEPPAIELADTGVVDCGSV